MVMGSVMGLVVFGIWTVWMTVMVVGIAGGMDDEVGMAMRMCCWVVWALGVVFAPLGGLGTEDG